MNYKQIFLVLALMLTSSPAVAQCSDGQDEICIFWSLDTAECLNCEFSTGEPLEAFVVLINASQDPGDPPGYVLPLFPCTGDAGFRIACLNDLGCPPPISAERTSWGVIKGLFR